MIAITLKETLTPQEEINLIAAMSASFPGRFDFIIANPPHSPPVSLKKEQQAGPYDHVKYQQDLRREINTNYPTLTLNGADANQRGDVGRMSVSNASDVTGTGGQYCQGEATKTRAKIYWRFEANDRYLPIPTELYDTIATDKLKIEKALGVTLNWERLCTSAGKPSQHCGIGISRVGDYTDVVEREDMIKWHAKMLNDLYNIIIPYLRNWKESQLAS